MAVVLTPSQFNYSCMSGLAPYLADPVIAAQATDVIYRTVTGVAIAATGTYQGLKRLRSATEEMPLFGPTKKQKVEAFKRLARGRGSRMKKQLQFKGMHTFQRNISASVNFSPASGFAIGATAFSQGMQMAFSLQEVTIRYGALSSVGAVSGATDLSALFDAWRIKSVTVKIFCSNNSSSINGITTGLPLIYSAVDNNDDSVPTTREVVLENSDYRVAQLGDGAPFSRTFKPSLTSVTAGNTSNVFQLPKGGWLPTSNPAAKYLGLKLWSEATGSTTTTTAILTVHINVTFECKDYN